MFDWQAHAREQLASLGLPPGREDEIVRELAAHLQNVFDEPCRQGVSPDTALTLALAEVPDWGKLRRAIRQAEKEGNHMNHRVKAFWLPGVTSLVLAFVFGWGWVVVVPRLVPRAEPALPVLTFWPWLFFLVLLGALTASWSRRAGGSLRARLLASLLLALVSVGAILTTAFAAVIRNAFVPLADHLLSPANLARALLNGAIIQGACLLIGALPFLRDSRTASRSPAR